ncbi:MAG: hypothetical protein U0893_12055 [Chloroflexota bacterium]
MVGEMVLHLEARLFFTHRGVEKVAEGHSVRHGLLLAERTCGVLRLLARRLVLPGRRSIAV